jgi:predicted exporter
MGLKGMFGLQVNDSPRSLAALPGALAEKDRFIRNIIGESLTQQYLVIEGKTTEDVLQTLENLQAFMRTEVAQHWAEFGPMITISS